MVQDFSYREATSRNIGWVTPVEQEILRYKRVAIAGLGGVGGIHLLTLARLGVGAFHIADFDVFDLVNFNRQIGATVSSLNRPKSEVLAVMARDINPELNIKIFPQGVNPDNLPEFFEDVDLYIDGLDFFAFSARAATFSACQERGIPAITTAPLGMGSALLNFLPGKMTFEEYFQWGDLPEVEKALRFLIGLAPTGLHARYLLDPSSINLKERRGPSTIMGCQLCAGIAATEALKILLNRGTVLAAPHGVHFDAYRNKLIRTWRPGGNSNPLQQLSLAIARRRLSKKNAKKLFRDPEQYSSTDTTIPPESAGCEGESKRPADLEAHTLIEQILDLARWAPSGDNTQPWRFQIVGDNYLIIHGFDTREHCVYDLDGRPSQISIGALLETISIAATGHGLKTRIQRIPDCPDTKPTFDIHFETDAHLTPDPLIPYIPYRSVQRRPMSTRPLTGREKGALEAAVKPQYDILWLEGFSRRLEMARFLFDNAKLRLIMPEAYQVHRAIIQWNSRYSADKVPDQALGVDPLTARLMRWIMGSWNRVEFFNTFLAGTWAPRLQMDLIPGMACAGHFVILAPHAPRSIDDYVSAGRVMQRFWLTATKLGLQLQPEITPLVFARYSREGIPFSKTKQCIKLATSLTRRLDHILGEEVATRAVFMGRIGAGKRPTSRSIRLELEQMLWRT
ncbi:Nitroreductase family protein [Nitrosospira multiformis]|uniref:Nitroreductase family protein n=1 Tax=Nitrosospira multiformis TaxID=1231 RepID=A0A1I0ADL1_9PROT|nr:Nitroreductase family protein [Nitrosospira multiformis]